SRWRPCITFSSSALLLGWRAKEMAAGASGSGGKTIGLFSSASVSPEEVSLSFATATTSPATAEGICCCFFPSSLSGWPMRSRPSRAVLMQLRSAWMRPETTRSTASVPAGARGRQVGRRRAFLERARLALVEEGLPGEHVDHAPELRLGADRYLEDGGPGADRLQVLERVLDGRPLAVEAGDEGDAREAEILAPPPHPLHLYP